MRMSRKPFFPNWEQQEPIFLNERKILQKIEKKNIEIFRKSFLMKCSVSRIVPKTLRSTLRSQNVSFLVKIEGGGLQ